MHTASKKRKMKRDRSSSSESDNSWEEVELPYKLQVVYTLSYGSKILRYSFESGRFFVVSLSNDANAKAVIIRMFDELDLSDLSNEMRQQIRDTLIMIPDHKIVKEALTSLGFGFLDGPIIETVCTGRDAIFVHKGVWIHFQYGRKLNPEELVTNRDVFKKNVLPFLSYKDIQRLESSSIAFRKNIMNFDVWQDLFQRDYPELYNPEIFSAKLVGDRDKWRSYAHIHLLDNASTFQKQRPFYEKSKPPLWKLLYEYQKTNRFDAAEWVINPDGPTDPFCTFYRGKILTIGNLKFMKTLPGEEGKTPDLGSITLRETAPIWLWLTSTHYESIYSFEFNDNFIYISLRTPDGTFLSNLWSWDDLKGPAIVSNSNQILECGLIGDSGYYFAEEDPNYVMNFSWPANIKYRHVLVDRKRGLHKAFDAHLRVIPCYSTPSETFLLYDVDAEQCDWYRLKSNAQPSLITGGLKFNPNESFLCTYSNRWLVYAPVQNTVVIVRAGVPEVTVELRISHEDAFRITDGCIVGDQLFLFQSRRWIVVVDLHKAYNREEMELSRKDTYFAYPFEERLEYVRMTIFGPALCVRSSNRPPLMLILDTKKIKLVSCQVCQVPVTRMCSLCKTPSCSKEHMYCCMVTNLPAKAGK